jgi:hypothetical protein
VECSKHIGKWYGGPGLWCDCATQECGYCGSVLNAYPDEERYEDQRRVVIEIDDLTQRIIDLSEPISTQAVIDLLEELWP